MTANDILKFKESIKDLSETELEELADELRGQISKMILDSDVVLKASIIDRLIKDKKGE